MAWQMLKFMIRVFQRIQKGSLRIVTPNHVYEFPPHHAKHFDASSGVKAELRVISETFWVRLCTMGDLGFSEAYMYGEVECDDLLPVFLVSLNRFLLTNHR